MAPALGPEFFYHSSILLIQLQIKYSFLNTDRVYNHTFGSCISRDQDKLLTLFLLLMDDINFIEYCGSYLSSKFLYLLFFLFIFPLTTTKYIQHGFIWLNSQKYLTFLSYNSYKFPSNCSVCCFLHQVGVHSLRKVSGGDMSLLCQMSSSYSHQIQGWLPCKMITRIERIYSNGAMPTTTTTCCKMVTGYII